MKTNLFFKYGLVLLLGFLLIQNDTFGQARTIKGRVTDAGDGSPIVGVTVTLKGTTQATQSDVGGNYSISVPGNNAVLVFSFVGMTTQEAAVGSRNQVDVVLQSDQAALDEVVVIGYGTVKKKDLTGSVAVVDVNKMKQQPVASAVESLQGKVTGVQVVTDGAPGATPLIRIRGYSTINNNDPLYVIDGVPVEGKLSWLNQNDIESMQVLKDASAASIYGARANNGVVIITTKKGTRGAAKFSFDAYYGTQTPRRNAFPEMMTPTEYANYLIKSYQANPAQAGNVGTPEGTGVNYGPSSTPVLPEYLVAGSAQGHNVTAAAADMAKYNYSRNSSTFYQITKANKAGTDWFREITQNAPIQNYQLSVSGGNPNSTYMVSGGYMNQQGIVKYTGFERYNVRANSTFSAFNSRLRIAENLTYSLDKSNGVGVNVNTPGDYIGEGSVFGFAYRIPTIIPVYDEGGNFAGSRGNKLGNAQNPMAMLYRAKDNGSKNNQFFGNVSADLDVLDNLTLRTNFGVNYNNWTSQNFWYPNLEFSEGSNNNGMTESMGYGVNWTWTNTATWNQTWGSHKVTVLAGTEAVDNKYRNISGSRNEYYILGNQDYYYLNTGSSNFANSGSGGTWGLFSLFGRVEYGFKDKYLLSGVVRRDGSSNFGPANKYGVFPAFSAAWRVSKESFLEGSDFIDDLKVRVGYGVTGNQSIPNFQYVSRFVSALNQSAYPLGGSSITTGVWQNAYENANIKWEEARTTNLGIDFALMKGVLDGAIDLFNKNTVDMLYPVPLPNAAVGMGSSPFVNIGDMNNRGIEFALTYHHGVKQKRAFEFDAGINLTHYKNKIVSLAPGLEQQNYGSFRSMETSVLKKDYPFASFYGYNVIGIYQSAEDLKSSPVYDGARVGGLKYQDISGPNGKPDGVVNAYDRTIIGNPHPDLLYSVSFNGRYKSFDVSMFFNGSQGNDIYDATRYYTDFSTFDGTAHKRVLNAWSPTNTGSQIPSPYRGASSYEYNSSSYFVQDGSFFRLKNLQIGYTLPKSKLLENKFDRVRIYVTGTNLFTITKYEGLDPEVSQTGSTFQALGVDFGVYPLSRQYLVGISLGF